MRPKHRKADEASRAASWAKDYDKVVELLAPYEERLTLGEKKKLDYARRHRRKPGGSRAHLLPLASAVLLSFIAFPVLVEAAPAGQAVQGYVNPGRTVREQIAYVKKNWPQQFGVGVVEALEAPKPAFEQDGVAYYYQDARPVAWIFIRWFHPDPQAPGDRFKMHYWVRPKRGERPLEARGRGIVFLIPARAQGIFVTEMILVASQEAVFEVRRAMIEAIP